jgi:hypothetical protein
VQHCVARPGRRSLGLKTRAARKYGENSWAIASALIDSEVEQCAKEIKGRWIERLEGVDIWAASHCRTALVYEEWGRWATLVADVLYDGKGKRRGNFAE